ncbi:PadR family transcriptional regulator [Hespellia stercorisuis]|uniref:PadR family transcriptional regulator, regulatory protein PadR n=1 Tax=Hespellia stercorisuis DSM 15480 TaxID=1121950 RepID=A0A1M6UAH8_9FIRM|nr:PadR family transcriptional regulator [Hespellia stercorisuis]SHK66242.1 PadR family transcriptional regulator, regulatory protein PadR [Hespellia stercorisuis DSM 15480]
MIFTLNAPMFDFLVLAIIDRHDTYGYEISQTIKQVSNTKDSTLYPVLKRLQEKGCVTTYDEQFQGRNRKYYRITDNGRIICDEWRKEWSAYRAGIDRIANCANEGGAEGGNEND